MKELTWKQIIKKKAGEVLHDEMKEGFRFIVMRGPNSLCGYIGVPLSHPLSGFDYDDVSVSAHGGFTFVLFGFVRLDNPKPGGDEE
jgi:hypothetical protein